MRELFEAPFVVFARVVAGEVGGRNVGDCLGVDAYNLGNISLCRGGKGLMEYLTFRLRASSGDIRSGAMIVVTAPCSLMALLCCTRKFVRAKAANSRRRRRSSSASLRSYIRFRQEANSIKTPLTVSLIPPRLCFTFIPSSHRTQWHCLLPVWPVTVQNDTASGPPLHAQRSPIPVIEGQSQSHHLAIMPLHLKNLPTALASSPSTTFSATSAAGLNIRRLQTPERTAKSATTP